MPDQSFCMPNSAPATGPEAFDAGLGWSSTAMDDPNVTRPQYRVHRQDG